MHEITFMKCLNSLFLFVLFAKYVYNKKKCDMFLIAAVTKDNDLLVEVHEISRVIHAVVGAKKEQRNTW